MKLFPHQEISMLFNSSRLVIGALLIGVGLGTGQAFAADADAIAKALVAAFEANGKAQASYADASANGDDVTINEFKVTGGGDTLTIPAVVITGAAARDKGGFTAKSMEVDGGTLTTSESSTIKWETAEINDAMVPSPEEIKAKAHNMSPLSKVTVGKINLSGGGLAAPIDIDDFDASVAVESDGTPNAFTTNINGIKIPPALFNDPQQAAVLSALGYTNGFNVSIAVDGGYEHATNTVTLRSFTIDTADVGKLAIDGKFSGVPLSSLSDSSAAREIQTKGKLESFHLRFDNAGIVEKVLDMQAKQAGMQRADIVSQFTGALPLLLNFIGNEAFQGKITTAVTAFLNDPKSITLSAAPNAPVGFDAIFSAVGDAPQTVPDLVGADISANN
jgi:hypothetical protein